MPAQQSAIDLSLAAAEAAANKLATDIVVLDVSEQLVITDCFVLCSGANELQVKSIVDSIEETLLKMGRSPCAARTTGKAMGPFGLRRYCGACAVGGRTHSLRH